MDQRIITETEIPVLLYRFRDDDGEDYVVVQAWETDAEGRDFIKYERVQISNKAVAKDFIRDYSTESATRFLERHPL